MTNYYLDQLRSIEFKSEYPYSFQFVNGDGDTTKHMQLNEESAAALRSWLDERYPPKITLKERYDDLSDSVLVTLIDLVAGSKIESKFMNTKALKVNVFDYVELVIVNQRLTFLGRNGLRYGLYAECSLEDLVDIITANNG